MGIDGAESQGVVSPRQNTASPESQSPTRAVSSADGTTKNGEIAKPSEVGQICLVFRLGYLSSYRKLKLH